MDETKHTQAESATAAAAAAPDTAPAQKLAEPFRKPPARSRQYRDARQSRYARTHVIPRPTLAPGEPDPLVKIGGTEYRVGPRGNIIRLGEKRKRGRRG